MSKFNSKSATPSGVFKQTQQQHFNQQKRAPVGVVGSVILVNFIELIHYGQEKQYSIESELCKEFGN